MEILVLDGKNYVKASKAARDLGYATDYVGQLCRSGQVDAHLIGRTWYVNMDDLGTHRVEKKRNARVKAREHARKAIEEVRAKEPETKKVYKNIDIQYEEDDRELIPKTRKLAVQAETRVAREIADAEYEEGHENIGSVENAGKKVVMSGDIPVHDVTDGPFDPETTYLHPRISRKKRVFEIEKKALTAISDEDDEEGAPVITRQIPTFAERLAAQDLNTNEDISSDTGNDFDMPLDTASVTGESSVTVRQVGYQQTAVVPKATIKQRGNLLLQVLIIFLTITIVALITGLYTRIEYANGSEQRTIHADYTKAIDIIRLKI